MLQHDHRVTKIRVSLSLTEKQQGKEARRDRENPHDDAADGNEDAEDRLVVDGTARDHPPQGDNGTRFDMADDGARHRTRLGDDEELGNVEHGGAEPRLERGGITY